MVRSCYYGLWKVPGVAEPVLGRYCFAPPGAPFYPGLSWAASSNFATVERAEEPPPIGELLYNRQLNPRPYFVGNCALPINLGSRGEAEGGDLPTMGGGEAEGGELVLANVLTGGEAEGGYLQPLRVTVYGGEAEGGLLRRDVRLYGGEAEGGLLRIATERLTGGEAEGGTIIPRLQTQGGEAEGGTLVGADLAGGEAEGGDLGRTDLSGGEAEGGTLTGLFFTGGEAEGGTLTPRGTNIGGEAEGGELFVTYRLEGGEAEGGTLDRFPTTPIGGGEAEGFRDLAGLFSPDLWLDGRQLTGSQGNPVALWPDLSGNGNNFVQGNPARQPTFDPVGSGRINGVHFGAGAEMAATSSVINGSAVTVYAVVNVDTTIANIGAVLGWNAGFRTYPGVTNDPITGGALSAGNGGTFIGVSPWAWFGKPAMIAFRHNSVDAWLNGDGPAATGTHLTGFPGLMPCDRLGGFGWFGGFRGWIFEVLVYERALSDEEDYLVSWYLMTKWLTPPF